MGFSYLTQRCEDKRNDVLYCLEYYNSFISNNFLFYLPTASITQTQTHTYTHVHTCMYTYICMCVCVCACVCVWRTAWFTRTTAH